MTNIIEQIRTIGIVPVIAISDANGAVPLAQALKAGGLPCAEVTFRTAAAADAIRQIKTHVPDVLIGAGTILSSEQADTAINAGAQFLVSPGFNPKVVAHCREKNYHIVPGCATPSDMEAALEMGLTLVKFFPAEQAGGLAYIKAVAAPYAALSFLPTGGIGPKNLAEYLSFPRIVACGGSWMASKDLIDAGDFATIERLSREAAEIVRSQR